LLDVAAPLPGRDDKTGASALVVSVDIRSILKEEPLSELAGKPAYRIDNHSTMVITRDGKSQIFTPLVYLQRSSPLIGVVSPLGKGHLVFKDPSRGPVIVGFAYLEESSDKSTWAVISMAPQKEAFYPAIRLRNRIIGLGLVAIGVAWFISIFLARGITRPIRRLVLVTDLIAGGNLAQRADIRQDDEVGDLARSFNKMTDKLNMAIVSRDQEIIERKNAEEKLREEMEAKAKFIQLISNEVQTPLTVIREGLGVMEADSQDTLSPRQKNMLRIVRKSGETLAHLVRDIVEFHGIESETTAMNISINDINSVIEDVKTSMVPLLAEKRDVNLIYLPGKDLPKASFDRDKISLVLTNLLNLSIMTTSAGSVELISERKGQNAVLVRVKDERSTIPHDQLSSLFDKFDILGKEKDKKAGGSGLGLTISREIIRKHNGKIWAEPYGEKGVIFNFVLPVSERRDQQSL
jgi:signal transduction histidine kinase